MLLVLACATVVALMLRLGGREESRREPGVAAGALPEPLRETMPLSPPPPASAHEPLANRETAAPQEPLTEVTDSDGDAAARKRADPKETRTLIVAMRDTAGAALHRSTLFPPELRAQLVDRIAPRVCTDPPSSARSTDCTLVGSRSKFIGAQRDLEYEVSAASSGPLWIGAAFGDRVLTWTPAPVGVEHVALEIAPEALATILREVEVRVLDGTSPVEGAHVWILCGRRLNELDSDATGLARQPYVLTSAGRVRVRKDGFGVATRPIAAGEGSLAVDVVLEREALVTGTWLSPEGRPGAGSVIALAEGAHALEFRELAFERARAAEDGSFTLHGLAPGTYLIGASGTYKHIWRFAEQSSGGLELPEFVMRVVVPPGGVNGLAVREPKRVFGAR